MNLVPATFTAEIAELAEDFLIISVIFAISR
jgi:hypothetical protein